MSELKLSPAALSPPRPSTNSLSPSSRTPRFFVGLVASCSALGALSIDVLLPAFPKIRAEFAMAPDSNRVALLITTYFLGLAMGQLIYGPLSDRYGRRPLLMIGLVVYLAGALATIFAGSFTAMAVCRLIWGLGAAAPRSVALAMVRDTSEGEAMSRIMSLVMAVFIVVPVLAPSFGSALMRIAPWRIVFWIPVAFGVVVMMWVRIIPETLPPERRRPLSARSLAEAAKAIGGSRQTVGYGLAVTFLFGLMTSYIGGSELMIDRIFHQQKHFPLIFGFIASFMGLASLASARIVRRLGLPRLLRLATGATLGAGVLAMIVGQVGHGVPPLWLFIASMSLLLPLVTATVPGLNTAAMMPVPQVAGMAAALLGTVSTAGGSLLGAIVTGALSDSIAPFGVAALVFTGAAAFCVLVIAQGPRRPRDATPVMASPAAAMTGVATGVATGGIAADAAP